MGATKNVYAIGEAATLTLRGNDGVDYTSKAEFTVNEEPISGNIYTSDKSGTFIVKATYAGLTSNAYNLEYEDAIQAVAYLQKATLETYTGTWCQYCPRSKTTIDAALAREGDKIVPITFHSSFSATQGIDPFHFSSIGILSNAFGVSSFPTQKVNRKVNYNNLEQLTALTRNNAMVGIALSSNISDNTINIDVKVRYSITTSDSKIAIYLLEDGLIAPQVNAYNTDPNSPWYQKGNPIRDYVHDHTVRLAATNVLGDAVAAQEAGSEFSKNYTLVIPATYNKEKLKVVAVLATSNNTLINAQEVKVGADKDFDVIE